MSKADLIVKNGLLAGSEDAGPQDIVIQDGLIRSIESGARVGAEREVDAAGRLVSMGFVDAHVHIDKCLIEDRLPEQKIFETLRERISYSRELKRAFTVADVRERSLRALEIMVRRGTTTARTNVEADPIVGTKAVEGVLEAKAEMASYIDLQTVAFPQEGWMDGSDLEMDSRPYIEEALAMGLDAIGGNVNAAVWESDARAQVDDVFALAAKHDVFIDMHLDNFDNGLAFTLPYVLDKIEEYGFQGKVAGGHVAGISYVPDSIASKTIERVRRLAMTICVLPIRIRLTRVTDLLAAGANVTCATDNMRDAFTGLGTGSVLHSLNLLAHITKRSRKAQLDELFELGTTSAAKSLGLEGRLGLEPGKAADLVVLGATSRAEAIRNVADVKAVIKSGRVIASEGRLV